MHVTRCLKGAVAVAGLASFARIGHASVIISDTFDRGTAGSPVALNGAHPDVPATGLTWVAPATYTTNGSVLNAPTLSGGSTASIASPFTPAAGNAYTITVSMTTSDNTTNWGAVGFLSNPSPGTGASINSSANIATNTAPWMLIRGSGALKDVYSGDGNTNGVYNTPTVTGTADGTNTLSIILTDPTSGNWTVAYYLNGTPIDSYTYSSSPTIGAVALSNNATEEVAFSNFSLTSSPVPEPASIGVLSLAVVSGCMRRRRKVTAAPKLD